MAGRIPQDFIDDLLHRTDIVDVVEERLQLKRTGRNYSGLCPFHQEKSPSFSVNPEKQFFYCFGCGAGGNALGFVMEYDRLEFREAVETLAKRHGLEIPAQANENSQQDRQRQRSFDLLQRADDFFREQLRNHPERDKAINYLKQRGLDGTIAKRFGIGYAPPGWDNLLKSIGNEHQQALDEAGLVIQKPEQKKCYDRFRDRIMFPIVDMRGRVIAFGGRVLNDEKPKYLNSPETLTFKKHEELYGLYQARQANRELKRVVIVEGYMDVVALAQFGINNAVATLGTATSEHHLRRLFKLMPEVVFCFDGDKAGRKAAQRALDNALALMEDGRQARFLFLPDGEDPDTMVRLEGTDAFNQRIDQALPLSQFLFDSLSEDIDLNSGEGRARLSALAMPLINKIPGAVLQQLMRQQLSELSGLDSQFFTPATPHSSNPKQPQSNYQQPPDNPSYDSHSQPPYNSNDSYDGSYDTDYGQDYSNSHAHDNSYNNQKKHSPGKRYKKEFNPPRSPASRMGNLTNAPASTRALHRLLHLPKLALKIDLETSDLLDTLQNPELSLLKALIEQLRSKPNTPTAVLIMQWRDSSYSSLLEQLGRIPLELDADAEAQTFIAYLHLLTNEGADAIELSQLRAKKASDLNTEQKKRLAQLLMRKQNRRKQARQEQ